MTRNDSPRAHLSRRDLLRVSGLGLGALALARPASAQSPRPGGTFVSAQTTEATGLDPQLVPGVLAQSPLAALLQPARALRCRPHAAARAGRVVGGEQGRPHLDVQAPAGREVPRRPGADLGRRQVHLRPALREVAGQVGLHRGGQGRAGGEVPGQVRHQGAVRRPPRLARRLLGLHHQRGRHQEVRRPEQGRAGHGPLHPRGLEGGAAAHPQEAPPVLQEGPALRGPGNLEDDPRRGEHRGRAPHRPDPARLHRGQQELESPQGREDAHRLSQLAAGLRLPQHQRQPGSAEGCARPPGHQLGGGSERGAARGRRRLRAPHRAGHAAHEGLADPRGAVDALLQARRGEGQEAHGRRGSGRRLHREAAGDPHVPHHGLGGAGGGGEPQAHRHHRGDRERGVRGVDQALAGQGLRHDHEHHAGLRRPGHGVLPGPALHQGPELEQLERAGGRRPPRGRAAHDGPEEAQGDLRQGPDPRSSRTSRTSGSSRPRPSTSPRPR